MLMKLLIFLVISDITITSTPGAGGTGEITGSNATLNVYDSASQSIEITNNSNLNLNLNNMETSSIVSGQIIKNGTYTGSYTENNITDTDSDITVTSYGDVTADGKTIDSQGGNITINSIANAGENAQIAIKNGTVINATNGNVALLAEADNNGLAAVTSVQTGSEIYGNTINITSDAYGSSSTNEQKFAYTYVTDSTVKGNIVALGATGGDTDSSNPFTNAEARLWTTNSTIEAYDTFMAASQSFEGFNADAKIQFTNTTIKSQNANIDVNPGTSDFGGSGLFYTNGLTFIGGTFDVDVNKTDAGSSSINMNASTTITSGSFNKQLIINADGTVDRLSSNIGAEVTDTTVYAAPVYSDYIQLNADTVGGSATFNYYDGPAQIYIANNSNKDMTLNYVSTDQMGYVNINGTNYDTYGSFIINRNESPTPQTLNITNDGAGDLTLNSYVYNELHYISILNLGGDIIDNFQFNTVKAPEIILNAIVGDITGVTDGMHVELLGTEGGLTATASGNIAINASSGDLRINEVTAGGDVYLESALDMYQTSPAPVTVGGTLTLVASGSIGDAVTPLVVDSSTGFFLYIIADDVANIQQIGGSILLLAGPYNVNDLILSTTNGSIDGTNSVNVFGSTFDISAGGPGSYINFDHIELVNNATVNASADGSIDLDFYYHDVNLGLIQSLSNDVTLESDFASILDSIPGTNVYGTNITLNSNGAIGSLSNPIDIDLQGGVLNASAEGLVNIINNTNDIHLGLVESSSGDVYIDTTNGSILNEEVGTNVRGNNINLYSSGTIGTVDEDVDIELQGGSLTAYANGVINIQHEVTGDLYVNHVESSTDDVYLSASDGGILEDGGTTIIGQNIFLAAYGDSGQIGESGNPLLIDLEGGDLTALAEEDIYIQEIFGDLSAYQVISYYGNVSLSTEEGSIVSGDPSSIVYGSDISLDAYSYLGTASIGTDVDPLNIELNGGFLTAYANDNININVDSNDLYVNHVESFYGDVKLTNNDGSIEANSETIVGYNIDLYARGAIGAEDTVTIDLQGGDLTAVAYGVIDIYEESGDLYINHVESYEDSVYLLSDGDIFDASGSTAVMGYDINLLAFGDYSTIEGYDGSFHIDLQGGELNAFAYDLVDITADNNDLVVDYVESENSDVYLTAPNGDILAGDGYTVAGYNVDLEANGYIGIFIHPLGVQLKGGSLWAEADDGISIFGIDGDLILDHVVSYNGDVYLCTDNGSILQAPYADDIMGGNIWLYANGTDKTIGTGSDSLHINLLDGFLTAGAYGIINITETSDELLVNNVESQSGHVYLTADTGNITDSKISSVAATGYGITLDATSPGGSIGDPGWFNIDLIGGEFNAYADSSIFINAINNDFVIDHIESYNGSVTLLSNDGDILEGSGGGTIVAATNITLDPYGNTVGDSGNPLQINITGDDLNPNTWVSINNALNIYVNETSGNLLTGYIHAANDIELSTTNGSILRKNNSIEACTNITLNANGGSIGEVGSPLMVELGDNLTAYADGVINIESDNSDIYVNHVESYSDDVYLTANDGSILEFSGITVVGYNIFLESEFGIGTSVDPLYTDLLGGSLTAHCKWSN